MAQGGELGNFESLLKSEDEADQEFEPFKMNPPVDYDGKGECSEDKRHIETLEREVQELKQVCQSLVELNRQRLDPPKMSLPTNKPWLKPRDIAVLELA